jgi:hypothetical protein
VSPARTPAEVLVDRARRFRSNVDARVVRCELLETAARILRQSAELLRESLEDLGGHADEVDHVLAAIAHVTEDDFRSHECRGGS